MLDTWEAFDALTDDDAPPDYLPDDDAQFAALCERLSSDDPPF